MFAYKFITLKTHEHFAKRVLYMHSYVPAKNMIKKQSSINLCKIFMYKKHEKSNVITLVLK